jgi:hypothetical protein
MRVLLVAFAWSTAEDAGMEACSARCGHTSRQAVMSKRHPWLLESSSNCVAEFKSFGGRGSADAAWRSEGNRQGGFREKRRRWDALCKLTGQ